MSSRQPIRLPLLVGSQLQIRELRCNALINHQGADTKKNVAGLLHNYIRPFGYHHFLDEKTPDAIDHANHRCKMSTPSSPLGATCSSTIEGWTRRRMSPACSHDYKRLFGYRPFLDENTTKPEEKMPDMVDHVNRQCKMRITVFVPQYCESIHCQLQIPKPRCNVFINHRGVDTKKNVAGLLHDYLCLLGYHPFLDEKTMKPGEKMLDTIDHAIRQCKMSIAIFSPRYCESIHCLNELVLMLETGKRLLPIFVDIKPSELMVGVLEKHPHAKQFHLAIQEAINTVGLTFDSSSGDWPKLMWDALDAVEWNFSD